jgi:hypothetical protein
MHLHIAPITTDSAIPIQARPVFRCFFHVIGLEKSAQVPSMSGK